MTFRTRLLGTFLIALVLPLAALAFIIRNEMKTRFTEQYERRIDSLVSIIEDELAERDRALGRTLSTIEAALANDNRFRLAAVDGLPSERSYLLDLAGRTMRLADLSMLQIQDRDGRIISSGHFRNEFDRIDASLPKLLASLPTENGRAAICRIRTADGPKIVYARETAFNLGSRRFVVIAGIPAGSLLISRFAPGEDATVELILPDSGGANEALDSGTSTDSTRSGAAPAVAPPGRASRTTGIIRKLSIPFIDTDASRLQRAAFRITVRPTELVALQKSIDRWFLLVGLAALGLALLLAVQVSARFSRPLSDLAEKAERVELVGGKVLFRSSRKDEIGQLAKVLSAMTRRLRTGAVALRNAERRATLGEIARQVNHDIKNGLTPIRNVFEHLKELDRENPERISEVFRERKETLASSIEYLDNLARNYSRLAPDTERTRCNVGEIVRQVVQDFSEASVVPVHSKISRNAIVLGDPVSIRRVLENLISNALEAIGDESGEVRVSVARLSGEPGVTGEPPLTGGADAHPPANIQITVTDTGPGIPADALPSVFDDFYTTRETGTGLGLSIARRLVRDLEGTISVESEEGTGTRFEIRLPAYVDR